MCTMQAKSYHQSWFQQSTMWTRSSRLTIVPGFVWLCKILCNIYSCTACCFPNPISSTVAGSVSSNLSRTTCVPKITLGQPRSLRPEFLRFETLLSECYNHGRNFGSDAGTGHRLEHLDQVINNHLIASNQSLRYPYFYNHPMGLQHGLLGVRYPHEVYCCFSA